MPHRLRPVAAIIALRKHQETATNVQPNVDVGQARGLLLVLGRSAGEANRYRLTSRATAQQRPVPFSRPAPPLKLGASESLLAAAPCTLPDAVLPEIPVSARGGASSH
jgi:hypothetical protein